MTPPCPNFAQFCHQKFTAQCVELCIYNSHMQLCVSLFSGLLKWPPNRKLPEKQQREQQQAVNGQTRRSYPLSPEIQLLAALRFYAVGSFLEVVGDGYRILRVIGLVEGTLIPIANPLALDQAFICRKGFVAINVQMMMDNRRMFAVVVAKWPGGTHDSFVWANSVVGQDAERGVFGQSFFLGDSSYPLRAYLLNPVTNPTMKAEYNYNIAHIHTRNLVEHSIGRWKMHFLHKSVGGLLSSSSSYSHATQHCSQWRCSFARRGGGRRRRRGGRSVHNPPELRDALHAAVKEPEVGPILGGNYQTQDLETGMSQGKHRTTESYSEFLRQTLPHPEVPNDGEMSRVHVREPTET
ncbi:hypothetical protein H4Q32_026611 [Labeo rohita]|uniref:DDE Tnp4 domain-containing protein n=1 Tax=Labeo rohita TaxID=84645 RepID=A0ABQ8L467_LABRO|nr:hypothetical protein H4Q32_026611 [Labeo rohita]